MDTKTQDIMIKPTLIGSDASFMDVLQTMICAKTNSLLVVNKKGVLVGRVQSLDLIWQIKPGYLDAEYAALVAHFVDEDSFKEACEKSKNISVEELMEKDPHTLKPETPLMEAAMIAIEDKHARIPVVDKNNVPVGIVTRTELKKMMGQYLGVAECFDGGASLPAVTIGEVKALSNLLLPLAGNEIDKRIVKFAGCLAAALSDRAESITMLHVTGEGFLQRHIGKSSTRRVKGEIIETGIFRNSKKRQVAEVVQPMLTKTEADLKECGVKCPVLQKIVDGDYAQQILQVAEAGCFSTIIMGRRGLSLVSEIFQGSVSAAVLHKPFDGAVYIVGEKFVESNNCPVSRILVPIDGSKYALAAVREAAALASQCGTKTTTVTLLNVIDIAKNSEKTATLDKDAEDTLNSARKILLDAGVDEQNIAAHAHYGTPVDSILAASVEYDANLIMIGRKGRSAVQELLMGSVSSGVLHRCAGSSIAIISSSSDDLA